MSDVSVRELRNHGGDVLDRVVAGESVTVTRGGHPVAELRPLTRTPFAADVLLGRWRRLPRLDASELRRDVDALLNSAL